jgi:tetratricopeptide (TPR) repeat protein
MTADAFGVALGFAAPPHIDGLLRRAAEAYDDYERAEFLLWTALKIDESCLGSYFSLYKFYFYKRKLAEAENVALLGLKEAARQGGFTQDWTHLNADSVDWARVDAPQHFYLFTLKALAFMRLRLGRPEECAELLAKLQELDPKDSVGASVIRDVAGLKAA